MAFGGVSSGWMNSSELGWIYDFSNGWIYSMDLGFVMADSYPWIYQINYGFFNVISRISGEGIWLYSPTHGFAYVVEGASGDFYLYDNGWVLHNFHTPQG
jgi:hypothetical protein